MTYQIATTFAFVLAYVATTMSQLYVAYVLAFGLIKSLRILTKLQNASVANRYVDIVAAV